MRQPFHERSVLEAVVVVVVAGVAVNWLGAHVLQGHGDRLNVHLPIILDGIEGQDVHLTVLWDGMEGQDVHLTVLWDRMEGQDMHLAVVRNGRGRNAFDGNQFGVMGVVVMLDGRMSFDLLETEQLSETIGESDCGVTHRVARATTGFNGRDDLDAIQPILAANRRRGWVVEELAGRADLIIGRD